MEPTLKTGSYIIGTRLFDDLQKGDIVVFRKDGLLLVKRIYGCPGDVIDRSELRYMKDTPIPVFEEQVIIVPENHYFLLGDNSADSWDSRYWEEPFVGIQNVVAKLYMN
jgi:signal peptidase I